MKTYIWNLSKAFPSKVNFIDSNNVVLGYDLGQNCCEYAFWTISEKPDGNDPIHRGDDHAVQEIELDDYSFDPQFCELEKSGDGGGVAIFKLIGSKYRTPRPPDLFLRLENHHNGYYWHNFTFRGEVIIQDSL